MQHRTVDELRAGMDHVLGSPEGVGTLELVVCRPSVGERAILEEGTLDLEVGLVGDSWLTRGSRGTPDGSAHPDAQLTVMNARAATLVAGPIERWGLAGDQLYVDLDLSEERLPAGSRLAIGSAVIEITAKPHRGCAKFAERFGTEATRFFNTGLGLTLNLRGRNARILTPGKIRRGDSVHLLQDAN